MGAEQAVNPLTQLLTQLPIIPYILIFFIFYFLVIKPQKDKQKEAAEMKSALNKNDEIVTSGGIHGTVVNVKEKTVVVRVDDNVKIEFEKEAIASVVRSKK
ncbi:MAG: preprotein translocase subunit YajC [Omnitrophica WOR_2 bacterium GWF2_38_59]|nr:MAG: preprotein translocase subunit YajC [Omnitrophica WOR_2 bacterium GWA2_37_7]OGX24981.1 MAG: preprotein translocase subunit YajC [Omnitrophica WOR_2 bacterium GWF2_38_59]OGX48415.1 MAG: preprotein translocase subunit YajC [Omnitrophica WOR_2 bacterium RIFOXYA2_FULL_38_17]OGX53074.1 MAG: preprotein translocase subunit YajC [Omnitrophica WOR_2 bacterium RIFOXYA12_FULL_38_10]OGX55851.1 MAG: preprotein translocase subunit YajC [Omnitrophica WOR_2 bacterium RIFOXYC2_FULL_38_12]OGX56920.1 MAG